MMKGIIHFRRLALEWLVQPEKSIEDVEAEMHTQKIYYKLFETPECECYYSKIREV